MSTISAIAVNTFKETIRDRVLYAILVFAIFMCLLSIVFGSLSIGNNTKIMLDFGLTSICIFGGILSIFIGTSLVFKEIDRRTIYVILSKPIDRWEFILGKFFGLSVTLTLIVTLMSLIFMGMLLLYNISMHDLYLDFASIVLIMFELYLITALSILFSSFSTPLLSMVFVGALWVIGHFNPVMLNMAQFAQSEYVLQLVTILHYILPDLSIFNIRNNIDNLDYILPLSDLFIKMLYGVIYSAIVLMIAVFAINRKEFN
ncbi:MAG: ABC transporter permease [Vampirovibrionia bacterium]